MIGRLRVSIIVPFHSNLDHLGRCLSALPARDPDVEVIVAADGAVDDCAPLAQAVGARLLRVPGPRGPAVARNRAAAVARGEILVFVDADVVVAPGSVQRLRAVFRDRPDIAAVFGAYDEEPTADNFVSQYKNLAHSYIHQSSNPDAQTFWAGLGAVRADDFAAVGGFDERFDRPSIEDIDLGYRLNAAGHRVLLDAQLRVAHLKRWTFRSLIASDVLDRGVPWTQLILRSGRAHNDLNIRSAYRVSVGLTYALAGGVLISLLEPVLLVGLLPIGAALYALNWRFYRFFARRRGLGFALRVVPLHLLYHLYNGVSFVVGSTIFLAHSRAGVKLSGALPLEPWSSAEHPTDVAREPRPQAVAVSAESDRA